MDVVSSLRNMFDFDVCKDFNVSESEVNSKVVKDRLVLPSVSYLASLYNVEAGKLLSSLMMSGKELVNGRK